MIHEVCAKCNISYPAYMMRKIDINNKTYIFCEICLTKAAEEAVNKKRAKDKKGAK